MKRLLKTGIFWTLLLALVAPVTARQLTLESHTMVIEGTSNVRDWNADVQSVDAALVLEGYSGESSALRPEQFRSLTLEMPVREIRAGNRGLTNNIHKYLKENVQPVIRFELQQVEEILSEGGKELLRATGTLSAAGRSVTVPMEVEVTRKSDGSLLFSGEQPLKMTDFGITPPTAMLGTIKAVDEFSVKFELTFSL